MFPDLLFPAFNKVRQNQKLFQNLTLQKVMQAYLQIERAAKQTDRALP
jgi:hypothetical protein